MNITRKKLHHNIYIAGLLLLAASVPLSNYFMSIAQMLLFGNWLVEGGLLRKLKQFIQNKAVLVFCLIFLMHVAGLLLTRDFDYAFKDLRTKVPLLLLPLIISTSAPLSGKTREGLILLYIAAVLGGSLASTWLYFTLEFVNIRSIFPFISHIRFSLNIAMAIVFMVYLMKEKIRYYTVPKILFVILIFLFVVFLFMAQSMTGLGILAIISLIYIVLYIRDNLASWRRILAYLFITALPLAIFLLFYGQYREAVKVEPVPYSSLVKTTAAGNPYFHDTVSRQVINGHPLWIYICEPELRAAWNRRSSYAFDGNGRTGMEIKNVLLRFMTSKGLKKDSIGVNALTVNEIHDIEGGCADVRDINGNSISIRFREMLWEYQNYRESGNASGFSLMMRLEYWKASVALIRENFWVGVGTGDMNTAFASYYDETHSKLGMEWRRRSHNQFLSITVGLGIIGLCLFLFALFYPPLKLKRMKQGVFLYFLLILLLSMLTEDTIESQAGVTFAAFFYSFLLFLPEKKIPTFESGYGK